MYKAGTLATRLLCQIQQWHLKKSEEYIHKNNIICDNSWSDFSYFPTFCATKTFFVLSTDYCALKEVDSQVSREIHNCVCPKHCIITVHCTELLILLVFHLISHYYKSLTCQGTSKGSLPCYFLVDTCHNFSTAGVIE